jgi:hypothetical protein
MFKSEHAHLIWDRLYNAYIPDAATQDTEFTRKFGVRLSGDRKIDADIGKYTTHVMIPIIKIVEYFDDGIPVQIPNRDDMLEMNDSITKYLEEWKHAMKYDIHLTQIPKPLLASLDKFCKYVYGKATAKEIVGSKLDSLRFGIPNRMDPLPESTRFPVKPDYEGISKLIRQKSQF